MNNEINNLLEEDLENPKSSDSELTRAVELANLIKASKLTLETLEKQIESEKLVLKQLEEIDLVNLMEEAGLVSFTLPSGEEIKIKTNITASILKNKGEEAYTWLIDNGFGDIIKSQLVVNFNVTELEKASQLQKDLITNFGITPVITKNVHHSTLSAFVREQIESGENIPNDLLGVFILKKALLK